MPRWKKKTLTHEQQAFVLRNLGIAYETIRCIHRGRNDDAEGDAMVTLVHAATTYDPSKGAESTHVSNAVRLAERKWRYNRTRWMTGDGGIGRQDFKQPRHVADDVYDFIRPHFDESQDDRIDREFLLAKLKARMRPERWQVLAMRFGLDGYEPHGLEKIARAFGASTGEAANHWLKKAIGDARDILVSHPTEAPTHAD